MVTLPPPLFSHIQVGQAAGVRNYDNCLYIHKQPSRGVTQKIAVLNIVEVFTKTTMVGSWFSKIAEWRLVTLLKYYITVAVFLEIFQDLQNSYFVTCDQLLLYLVYICMGTCIFSQFIYLFIFIYLSFTLCWHLQ